MKKYQKKSELTERTNLGFRTWADDLNIDSVNDQLGKVEGLGFKLHIGSKKPEPMRGGMQGLLRIEDINESVAMITRGMDGLFEQKKKLKTESSSDGPYVDEKQWHEVFGKIVRAIENVSKPAWGEWGNILSVPSLHVKAYDDVLKLLPQLLKLTQPNTDLYQTIEFASERFASKMKRQAEILLKKYKDELNDSNSQGFEYMQNLHNEFMNRVVKPIARARYS